MSLVRRAQDLPSRVHVSCNTQGCVSGLSRPFPGLLWVWSAVVIAVASHGGTGVGGRGIQGKARSCLQSVTSLGRHNRTAWRHWAEQRGDANNGSCSLSFVLHLFMSRLRVVSAGSSSGLDQCSWTRGRSQLCRGTHMVAWRLLLQRITKVSFLPCDK